MLIFLRILFMLLLWTRCNAAGGTDSSSIPTTISESSRTVATSIMFVVTPPTITHHDATSAVTEYDTQSNSVTPLNTSLSQQTFSTEDTTQSFTRDNRISFPSEIPTTTSNLLTISESYANTTYANQSEAASNSFSATTYDVNFSTMTSTGEIQTNPVTAPPSNTTPAILSTASNNAKTVLTTNLQTTSLHPSFTNSSTEENEPRKENHSNGGVIFGAIVGALLGSALIGLVGYFMCKKRKSEGFVHQRLYDDTSNDPVLRLDNVPESYGASFADLSYHNPMMANETTVQNSNTPYDAIPMDNMTLSPHLP